MQQDNLRMLMLYQLNRPASQGIPGVHFLFGSLILFPKSGTVKLDSAFNQMEFLSKHVIKRFDNVHQRNFTKRFFVSKKGNLKTFLFNKDQTHINQEGMIKVATQLNIR